MNGDKENKAKAKVEKWLKGCFLILVVVSVGVAAWYFVGMVQKKIVLAAPVGYRLAIAEDVGKNNRVVYYVYDDKVFKEEEKYEEGELVSDVFMVYDGVDTSAIEYEGEDATGVCTVSECKEKKKALAALKKTLNGKASREYIGR